MLLAAALSTDPAAPAQVQFEMRHLEDKYRNQVLTMACTMVSLVDLRDSYTGEHSSGTQHVFVTICRSESVIARGFLNKSF